MTSSGPADATARATRALRRTVTLSLVLSFVGIWLITLPFLLGDGQIPGWLIFVGRYLPLVATLVAWAVVRPMPLGRLWRTSPVGARSLLLAALTALVVVVSIDLAHTAAALALGVELQPQPGWWQVLVLTVPIMLIFTLSTVGEEVLWRGALRTAWGHLGFWRSALLIALAWTSWHLPLHLAYHVHDVLPVRDNLASALALLPLSVLLCALADRFGTVWVAVLAHAVPRGALQQNLVPLTQVDDTTYWTVWVAGAALTLLAAWLVRRGSQVRAERLEQVRRTDGEQLSVLAHR